MTLSRAMLMLWAIARPQGPAASPSSPGTATGAPERAGRARLFLSAVTGGRGVHCGRGPGKWS